MCVSLPLSVGTFNVNEIFILTDTVDADWGDLHDKEGEDPVAGSREGGSSRANRQWRVLGRQEPGDSQQTNREEEVEQEQHYDRHDSCALASIRNSSSQNSHACTLTAGSEQHELAASEALDAPDGDQRREEVCYSVKAGQQ